MAAITEAQSLELKKKSPLIKKLCKRFGDGFYKFPQNFDATSGALVASVGDDLTGTTAASFTVDSDCTTDVKLKLATNTSADGNYTITIQPATGTWSANRTISIPDPGGADTIVMVAATQTLTNKTLTTPTLSSPTIADFTNATHDHSSNAKGGALSLVGLTGTLSSSFTVDSDSSAAKVAIYTNGATGDYTATIVPPNLSADATLTLPASTGTIVGTGQAITGYIQLAGSSSGGIKIAPIASGSAVATIQNQAVSASTITLPSATCTLPGLGLTNTFSAAQAVTSDDTTDGVVDVLTLTHSSSDNNATAADGVGVSFQLENATGTHTVEEWASLDVVSTTITDGSEDGDVVLKLMCNGTVTEALRVDSSDQMLNVGQNATDDDNITKVRIYSATASKGAFILSSTANSADKTVTLTNAATSADVTVTIPASTTTLAGLAVAQTFTAAQTVVVDDTTEDGVTNVLVLGHTTSGSAATGLGTGISILAEDAGGSQQQAKMEFALATNTNGHEDCDFTLSVNLDGAITQAFKIDSANQKAIIGANATDDDGIATLQIYPVTASRGSLILTATAHASADYATTIQTATDLAAAATLTLPNATATLATLGLAETFSGVKTFSAAPVVAIDAAAGVSTVATLTKTTSGGVGQNNDGAKLSVIVENATDATTEVASMQFVNTTAAKATCDTDLIISTMLGGAVSQAILIDASAQEVVIGASASDADGINTLRIYPHTTASRGSLVFTSAINGSGNFSTTVTQATTVSENQTITIPDAAGSSDTFGLLGTAQTFSAVKTFTAMPLITSDDTTNGVVDALTLTHSSSDDNATALDGVGISFKLENATGTSTVEEWGSIDVLSTTITDGSEDADFVLSLMLAGTVTEALRLDSSDESLTIGSNATNSDGINRIRIYPQTATKGSLIISSTANSTNNTFTLTNAAAGSDVTVTIPASTTTLAGLAVAQTFTAAQTVTLDDTTDGISTLLTLTHSSSDNQATAGDGVKIVFQLENATGTHTVEEWGRLSLESTSITNGAEDADWTMTAMVAGALKTVWSFDADEGGSGGAKLFQLGSDANAVSLDIHPATTARGTLRITAADSTGDTVTTITNAEQAGARTYTVPDAGGNASFVMNAGAQTVAGAKTFSTMPIIPAATVAAAGDAQGNAAAITTGFTVVTAADGTKGVKLPTAVAGLMVIVKNNANNTLKLYPNSDDAINAIAANTELVMGAYTSCILVAYDATHWYTIPLLPS